MRISNIRDLDLQPNKIAKADGRVFAIYSDDNWVELKKHQADDARIIYKHFAELESTTQYSIWYKKQIL